MMGIITIVGVKLLTIAVKTKLSEEKILFSFEKEEVEKVFKIEDTENTVV